MANTRLALPRTVWALGLVSLCMDTSSELIHALLPLFMVATLGASASLVGLVEGIAEATASFVKIGSGALSDWHGRRKPLALLGYGLAAASKVLFPLASSIGLVLLARFVDRVGKGIRGAPRDALVADTTPAELRGRAFGLRQALDSVGAVAGPLLATALMVALAGDMRAAFWVALLPAWLAVAILLVGVAEPPPAEKPAAVGARPWGPVAQLGRAYWIFLGVAALIGLARFGEAFLILAAGGNGLGPTAAPLVLAVMHLVYAATAYPAGALSDRWGRVPLLCAGLGALAAADFMLAVAGSAPVALLGAALWGLHMGLSQGLMSALVADAAPPAARGTAFGLFNATSGVALLGANLLCGGLWDAYGSGAAFAAGGALALVALVALLASRPRNPLRQLGKRSI